MAGLIRRFCLSLSVVMFLVSHFNLLCTDVMRPAYYLIVYVYNISVYQAIPYYYDLNIPVCSYACCVDCALTKSFQSNYNQMLTLIIVMFNYEKYA
jgi:hypothetical protein